MIETDLYTYLVAQLPSIDWTYGKLNTGTLFDASPIGNFYKVPSVMSNVTPTYFDNIQISIRHEYIDIVQTNINLLIDLFQLLSGNVGSYQVWISSITNNGCLYEKEDLVAGTITLGIKYSIL